MTMSEDATIKDALTSDHSEAKTEEVKTEEVKVEAKADLDPEALEIGRILRDSGVTKDQVNNLLQAPKALEALQSALQGNPDEFFNMLQRSDPKAEEKLLQAGADRFVKRYGEDTKPGKDGKPDPNGELMREVAALKETVKGFQTTQEQRDRNAAMAAVKQRYDARVDDIFGQKEIKELGLTKSETKAMRARLDAELASDQNIVQRASAGNFVDVPVKFKGILDEWSADKKAAAEAIKDGRDKVKGLPEFLAGNSPFMNFDVPSAASDSWDATESALASALERTAR